MSFSADLVWSLVSKKVLGNWKTKSSSMQFPKSRREELHCFKSSFKRDQTTKVRQVNNGFKSQPPQCHPFPPKHAVPLIPSTGPHSAKQTQLNFACKTLSKSTQHPITAPAREQQDFRQHRATPSENFFGNSSASFIFQYLTPSLSHSPLQGNKLNPTQSATSSDKHPQKHPKCTAQHLKYPPNFT